MTLEAKVRRRMEQLLLQPDELRIAGPRLLDDARRLWRLVGHFCQRHLIGSDCDMAGMELVCLAIQLPLRHWPSECVGKYGQINLRDRAEEAAEEMLSELSEHADEALLDRAGALLRDLPSRGTKSDEARLLADVINLDDFGVTGIIQQTLLLSRIGQGLAQVLEAADKREAYGYFEARLKDGFHFGPVREVARQRLRRAKQAIALLREERGEDTA